MPSLLTVVIVYAACITTALAAVGYSSADLNILSRRMDYGPLIDSPFLSKRETRKEANVRIKLAKARAARSLQRKTTLLSPQSSQGAFLEQRSEEESSNLLDKRDSNGPSLDVRAFRSARCGSDANCQSSRIVLTLPDHGKKVCSPATHRCIVGCQTGYQLNGNVCEQNAVTCGPDACPSAPQNGIYVCSGNNVCTLTCNGSIGYTRSGFDCVNPMIDAGNCGTIGNKCGASYNNVGVPKCSNGACSLACPRGTSVRSTQNPPGNFFCA